MILFAIDEAVSFAIVLRCLSPDFLHLAAAFICLYFYEMIQLIVDTESNAGTMYATVYVVSWDN